MCSKSVTISYWDLEQLGLGKKETRGNNHDHFKVATVNYKILNFHYWRTYIFKGNL